MTLLNNVLNETELPQEIPILPEGNLLKVIQVWLKQNKYYIRNAYQKEIVTANDFLEQLVQRKREILITQFIDCLVCLRHKLRCSDKHMYNKGDVLLKQLIVERRDKVIIQFIEDFAHLQELCYEANHAEHDDFINEKQKRIEQQIQYLSVDERNFIVEHIKAMRAINTITYDILDQLRGINPNLSGK